jgi:AGZA family xanthine/uracil permease-like MFS transporter
LKNPEAAIAVIGLVVTALLLVWRVTGALVIGILLGTVLALIWGVSKWPSEFGPPSFANAFQADVVGALNVKLLPLLLAFLLVNFFDALGTITAIAEQAHLTDKEGQIPNLRNVLLVESASSSIGGAFGVSSVTAYIESAAGIAEGARTGLHSVLVGIMFLVAILAAPLAGMVPGAATAPAMILVGFLMAGEIARIDFTRLETAIPAFVTIITVPFTYSIAHGVGYGFITYVGIQVLSGKCREVHLLMYLATAMFTAYFVWG